MEYKRLHRCEECFTVSSLFAIIVPTLEKTFNLPLPAGSSLTEEWKPDFQKENSSRIKVDPLGWAEVRFQSYLLDKRLCKGATHY